MEQNTVPLILLKFTLDFTSKAQKQLAKEVKLNEDKIRSDAIDEYRKKQLLEIDLPMTHPLEYMGIWDGYRDGRIIGGFNNSSSSMKIDDKDKRVKFDSKKKRGRRTYPIRTKNKF